MKLPIRLLFQAFVFANLLLLIQGCGRNAPVAVRPPTPEEMAAAGQRLLAKLNQVFSDADNALAEGRTNDAMACVETALTNKSFATVRPQIVDRLARIWNIDGLFAQHNDAQALALLDKARLMLEPPESLSLIRASIAALLNDNRTESVEKVLALTATIKTAPAEIERLAVATQTRVALLRGDWFGLTNAFVRASGILNDRELEGLLQNVASCGAKAGRRDIVDQCAATIIFTPACAKKPIATTSAANVWARNAIESDKGAFPGRLAAMVRAKAPVAAVSYLFVRYFYVFSDQPAAIKELIAVGDSLIPLVDDKDDRNDIKIKLLDGCFITRDYDRALSLLEARIPGPDRNEQWHAIAIAKVKAHRALQRNEPREAVKCFREFINLMRASKDTEVPDPVTRLRFPKELVLGRNAKRIGDVLAGIPDAVESATAYAEAQDFYMQALTKTPDADARKVIETELATLPKAGGK